MSIPEETAAPGAGPAYPLCEDVDISADDIILEMKDCQKEALYDFPYLETGWRYWLLPTDPERRDLCDKCELLMEKLHVTKVPRCQHKVQEEIEGDVLRMPYRQYFEYAFALCQANLTSSPPPSTAPVSEDRNSSTVPATTSPTTDSGAF